MLYTAGVSLTRLMISFLLVAFTLSCSHYRRIENANSMVDLARNPFMKHLAKDMMNQIYEVSKSSVPVHRRDIRLTTPLNTVLASNRSTEFLQYLSNSYHIPMQKLEQAFPQWKTVRDAIGFVARQGQRFEFYKM